MLNNLSAKYKHRPLAKLTSLEKILDQKIDKINQIISNISSYYVENPPDEKGRVTYRVLGPLKRIQIRINQYILQSVKFPGYLHSFIKGRSPITNAKSHLRVTNLINEDVKKFFDNCSSNKILYIWKFFFKFPPEIANILTILTTFNNKLPQGASTSPSLSNLMFWQDEPLLVENLIKLGLTYTRYADDVSISSKTLLTNNTKTIIISLFYGMLAKNGFKPRRDKHKIFNSSQRMLVNGQIVNGPKVSLGKDINGKDYSLNLRAAIYELARNKQKISIKDFQKKYSSLLGKVNHLLQYKNTAQTLRMKKELIVLANDP